MRISDWSSDVCSSDLCAGHLDRHARAGAMLAAGPARVDQPTIDPTPGNTPAQKITVDAGMARHEGGAKASRECALGRASCRERVCQYVEFSVVAVILKKNIK